MQVGDLIYHKWGKDYGIVVGRPDPPSHLHQHHWHVMFGTKRLMVHEDSCEVLNEVPCLS